MRDILIELARKASVDLELDPRISGGIIMTATDRPFIDVIERICDLADLRNQIGQVCEELLMNALYDAPVDEHGNLLFGEIDLKARLGQLSPRPVSIRYAATEAVFRAAFINIGVSNCDMGTSWLLPRLIGASRSHELMLTGRRLDAEEALRIGLVADVVAGPELPARALEAAEQIASLAPWGVRLTKRGMWSALEIPSEQAAVEYEDRQQIMATFGRALPEAIGAFLDKRDAGFAD